MGSFTYDGDRWKEGFNVETRLTRSIVVSFLLLALVFGLIGCLASVTGPRNDRGNNGEDKPKGDLVVFHAGSLKVPLENLKTKFEKEHPNVKILLEGAGSRDTAKKVSELGRNCDVMALADYTVIDTLLKPDHADWNVKFATNRMVVTYTEKSKYADEVSADNWYDIFQRDGVRYGHSDPNSDPCGYRARLVFQLAEEYYGVEGLNDALVAHCPKENIRPKSVELVALLQAGEMDYAFEYHSVAKQHGLKVLELPGEINLGEEKHADFYAKVSVTLSDGEMKKGKPIVYGVTIPKNSENPKAAVAFVKMLLSEKGQRIFEEAGQPPLIPPLTTDAAALPVELKDVVNSEV